jgi:hypothetical protein
VNPWPIAKAPANFGKFSGAILIGNVEDGRINALINLAGFLAHFVLRMGSRSSSQALGFHFRTEQRL